MNICIIIPAYNPDKKLIALVQELKKIGLDNIIIIDDGSTAQDCKGVFEDISNVKGCHLLRHSVNLGKGRALKTGFNYFLLNFNECDGVVTADADGQHSSKDIYKIASSISNKVNNELIMGTRKFSKDIPIKSLIGNKITAIAFKFLIGQDLRDTQTGLRGINKYLLPMFMRLDGEGYEYETNMLIETHKLGTKIKQVDIETIYIDNNSASHFNPLIDSFKIYFIIIRFIFSSLFTSFIDFLIFYIGYRITSNVLASVIIARLFASLVNFNLNKSLVFHNNKINISTLVKYYLLIIFMGYLSSFLIGSFVSYLSISVVGAKIIVETVLFIFNFSVQREFIFKNAS